MVAVNIEQSTCNGRGFTTDSPTGILKYFHDWVTRAPVASPVAKSTGGPGWYIIDDQSITSGGSANKVATLATAKTGVGASFDTIAEIAAITNGEFKITINGVANDITAIDFTGDATWDDVAATLQTKIRAASAGANDGYDSAVVKHIYTNPAGELHDASSVYASSSENKHRFIIVVGEANMPILPLAAITSPSGTALHGSSYLDMDSSTNIVDETADPFIVVSDQAAPTAFSGAKFLKVGMDTTEAGQIFVEAYMWWDATIHRGFAPFAVRGLNTYDDADFVYDFRGGPEFISIGTRLGTAWDHFILDEWTDNSNLVEASTKSGNTAAAVAVGATSFNVGVGEGVNFTAGKYYWLIDLQQSETIEYVKVTNVATDTITIETATNNEYNSGALLTSYYQRIYTSGNDSRTYSTFARYTALLSIPLRSEHQKEWGVSFSSTSAAYSTGQADVLTNALIDVDPDDENYSTVMKPLIGENDFTVNYEGNRYYGTAKNVYITGKGAMAQMLDGRTISAAEWLYFQDFNNFSAEGSSSLAALYPNYNQT